LGESNIRKNSKNPQFPQFFNFSLAKGRWTVSRLTENDKAWLISFESGRNFS